MKPEEISPEASAALTRAIDAQQVEVYVSGGVDRIEFTADTFQAWFLAELAAREAMVRANVADDIAAEPRSRHRAYERGLRVAESIARGEA